MGRLRVIESPDGTVQLERVIDADPIVGRPERHEWWNLDGGEARDLMAWAWRPRLALAPLPTKAGVRQILPYTILAAVAGLFVGVSL